MVFDKIPETYAVGICVPEGIKTAFITVKPVCSIKIRIIFFCYLLQGLASKRCNIDNDNVGTVGVDHRYGT